MPCHGCGRHEKLVDANVNAYFCQNCFTVNGNYLRYLRGLDMVRPLKDIHVKDIVLGVDGRQYKIVGREDVSGEDKYYYCQDLSKKKADPIVLGDFFFTEKLSGN